jgi:hypothetical protein
MVDTQCFDCGYTDSGHVYTDDWKDELIVKRNGKIIINENLRKRNKYNMPERYVFLETEILVILQQHQIHDDNCDLCKGGVWRNVWLTAISSFFHDNFYYFWYWWVNL